MHLVKWIRKNERKIMAWVVILIMISFVGGYGLQQFLMYLGQGGSKRVIATYGDGDKIRAYEYQIARNELDILRSLMADRILVVLSQFSGDLSGNFLQTILFPDSQTSGDLRMQLVQAAQQGQLSLNVDQIDQFFTPHPYQPELLWILLKAEARQAGCAVTNTEAAAYLQQLLSALTQSESAASSLVSRIVNTTKKSENEIIRIFADLLGVMNYADMVLGNYTVTLDEIRVNIARNMERLTAEYLSLNARSVLDEQPEPTPEQINKQFLQYQSFIPDNFTADNPFGFGYKIPKRVQLEYFLVNMNDVRERIEKPTPEDLENYYSRHLSEYQDPEPIDPNDPDSEIRRVTRPFAQVVGQIRQSIENQKTDDLATMILNETRQLTEAEFDTIDFGTATVEQLQQAAGDYVSTAEEISQKFNVSVYTGKTGWLRPEDILADRFLGRIAIPSSAGNRVALLDILLAIPPDGKPSYQPGLPSVRIWENISPLSSRLYSEEENAYIPLRAMIRVIGVQEDLIPQEVSYSFENHGVTLGKNPDQRVFSLRDQVIEDIQITQAMETVRKQASALTALVEEKDWDSGLEQFYQEYYPQTDPNRPLFTKPVLNNLPNQMVLPQTQLDSIQKLLLKPSITTNMLKTQFLNALLVRKMYETMAPDQQSTGTIDQLLPFEQNREVCVIKELTKEPATEKDYQDNKKKVAMQLAMLSKMDLGLIHFNPSNVAKRMTFEFVQDDDEPEQIDEPAQEEES